MPLRTLRKDAICSLCQCHIRGNTLFADLTDSELKAFKDAVTISSCRKREIIFLGGDRCTGLYIIRKGRVKMVKSSASGKEQIIKILNPGDILGFEVLYEGSTYANTAVAMEDCELCHIKTADFFRILEKEPSIARRLIVALGAELKQAYDRIGNLGLMNAREKLAHLISTLASDYGTSSGEGVKLQLQLSRLEIAELLGITQETSIRLLKSFKEQGILDIRRKEIIIKSMDRLKEIGGVGG